MGGALMEGVRTVDYRGFVDLVARFPAGALLALGPRAKNFDNATG